MHSEGRLSTHVLDLTTGRPAVDVRIELFHLQDGDDSRLLCSALTNADGRTDEPLLDASAMIEGVFELIFHVGDYFAARQGTRFLDRVPVRFTITDANARYHVPLLVTPWAYQTYRGS